MINTIEWKGSVFFWIKLRVMDPYMDVSYFCQLLLHLCMVHRKYYKSKFQFDSRLPFFNINRSRAEIVPRLSSHERWETVQYHVIERNTDS